MDMEVITVGCTIHWRSWLVVIALMVGMKALPEPGISTRNFCKETDRDNLRLKITESGGGKAQQKGRARFGGQGKVSFHVFNTLES